jgi:hypothetical protein
LTSEERARIQTFPKTFKWEGINKSALEQIIGNAVPVNLAKFVGRAVMEYEHNSQYSKNQSGVYYDGCLFPGKAQRDYALGQIGGK